MNAFSIRRFAGMLLRAAPRATVASLVLMVLVALTEGAGLLLLLPLLALAGVDTGGPAASGLLAKVAPYIPHSLGAALLLYVAIVAARSCAHGGRRSRRCAARAWRTCSRRSSSA